MGTRAREMQPDPINPWTKAPLMWFECERARGGGLLGDLQDGGRNGRTASQHTDGQETSPTPHQSHGWVGGTGMPSPRHCQRRTQSARGMHSIHDGGIQPPSPPSAEANGACTCSNGRSLSCEDALQAPGRTISVRPSVRLECVRLCTSKSAAGITKA